MKFSSALIAFGLATFGLATAPDPAIAKPHGGIQGQAFLYISNGTGMEVEPGVWVAPPSVQLPIATTITVLSAHSGQEAACVTTDANGLYSLSLHPGDYLLVPDTVSLNTLVDCTASTGPIAVTVDAKEFVTANIFYFRESPCSVAGGN
jgi:hypothetical protein